MKEEIVAQDLCRCLRPENLGVALSSCSGVGATESRGGRARPGETRSWFVGRGSQFTRHTSPPSLGLAASLEAWIQEPGGYPVCLARPGGTWPIQVQGRLPASSDAPPCHSVRCPGASRGFCPPNRHSMPRQSRPQPEIRARNLDSANI